MLLLGHATERPDFCAGALLPAYWWADIAIDHVDLNLAGQITIGEFVSRDRACYHERTGGSTHGDGH